MNKRYIALGIVSQLLAACLFLIGMEAQAEMPILTLVTFGVGFILMPIGFVLLVYAVPKG